MKWAFAFAVLLFSLPASAFGQNEFQCDAEWSETICEEERAFDAYWDEYGDRYDVWFHELSFDTNLFFADVSANKEDADATRNLLDAHYSIALRRYGGWAFAVNMVCADGKQAERFDAQDCAPELRMLSLKPHEELTKIDPSLSLPKNRKEMAKFLAATMDWRETGLQHCKGAAKHFASFSKIQSEFWHKSFLKWLAGTQPTRSDVIVVTADGDNISIRAKSRNDPNSAHVGSGQNLLEISESNRGSNYDWAKKMAEIVEPCLKPSGATPPWQKVVDAEEK